MKRTLLALALFTAGAFVAGDRAYAHHSFAATYFEDQRTTIEGELVQFLYRNPHSFVHVAVKDKSGQEVRWAVEWGAGGNLGGQAEIGERLKPGNPWMVAGNQAANRND